jgi:hypothetical protein
VIAQLVLQKLQCQFGVFGLDHRNGFQAAYKEVSDNLRPR